MDDGQNQTLAAARPPADSDCAADFIGKGMLAAGGIAPVKDRFQLGGHIPVIDRRRDKQGIASRIFFVQQAHVIFDDAPACL